MRIIRTVAAASLFLASMGVTAVPAVAAAPANDTYSGIEVLTDPLPIMVSADTSEATTDADDAELGALCEGPPAIDATVWYSYTPAVDGEVAINTLGSDYSVGAIVATGSPGAWTLETCGPEVISFFAMSGLTYTFLVFDDQVDGGGNGGQLEFTVDVPPPPPSIEATVDPRGTFDSRTGAAVITGTYTCAASDEGEVDFAFLDVQLTQRAGRVLIQGGGFQESLQCDGTEQPWTADIEAFNGLFKGGKAEAQVFAEACGADACGFFEDVQAVKLSGSKK